MIMSVEEARKIVEQEVMASKANCVIVENATQEYSCCFVFFYQSKKFIETGDVQASLVGNGPIFVSRESGRVFETGSAFPVEHYVEVFEACGDPNAELTEKVKITGWKEGANKVQTTKLIKSKSGVGLAQAKAVIDSVLRGEAPVFSAGTVKDAEETAVMLNDLGFISKQLWRNQC